MCSDKKHLYTTAFLYTIIQIVFVQKYYNLTLDKTQPFRRRKSLAPRSRFWYNVPSYFVDQIPCKTYILRYTEMQKTIAIDHSAILYLSLMRKKHTNVYRFTMTLTEDVCPVTLQEAVCRVYHRFPTIIAGFYPGFFQYKMVPAQSAPVVLPDPGCLLTMSRNEIHRCAYRVFYRDSEISIEAFHALTDGYGAIASFTTLVAEYLRLRYGVEIPVELTLRDPEEPPADFELNDAYLEHQKGAPLHLPSRYAYQLPGKTKENWDVLTTVRDYSIRDILNAAHRHQVSATALLSSIMAASIMELQQRHVTPGKEKPVRIMIPVDLRRMFSSKTLRNFILYALPTMEPGEHKLPFPELLRSFHTQLQQQIQPKRMARIMAYNVRTQLSWAFRLIPRAIKCTAMRIAYRFFGERNSCITLTNLGNVTLPKAMESYIKSIEVILTPRAVSPYNCAIISYGGAMRFNISRFCKEPELEEIFFRRLDQILQSV